MRLTVLGCSGSGPGPTAPASGYLVTAGDTRLLLDLGNGSFGVAAAPPRPVAARRRRALAPARRPLRGHGATSSYTAATTRFGAADVAAASGVRPRRHRRTRLALAYAASPEERAATDLSDVLEFRQAADGGRVGEHRGADDAGRAHPVEAYAVRVEHGRCEPGLQRRHRSVCGARRARRAARTCCCARRRGRTSCPGGGPSRPAGCTCPAGRRASTRRRRGWAGCCSPTSRRGATRRPAGRGAGGVRRARRGGRAGRDLRRLSVARALPDRRGDPACPIHTTSPVTARPASAASTPVIVVIRCSDPTFDRGGVRGAAGRDSRASAPPPDEHGGREQHEEDQRGDQQRLGALLVDLDQRAAAAQLCLQLLAGLRRDGHGGHTGRREQQHPDAELAAPGAAGRPPAACRRPRAAGARPRRARRAGARGSRRR